MRQSIVVSVVALTLTAAASTALLSAPSADRAKADANTALSAAIDAAHRSPENRARDAYRHPKATLSFFGVKPTDTVVEVYPGGGWYTEILAPYLAAAGTYTVAAPLGAATDRIKKKMTAAPSAYAKVNIATFPMIEGGTKVADGSADVVLTFRNVHNWRFGGIDAAQSAFNQMFAMLKPGGTLGVVEHRLPEKMASAKEEKSGYMKKSSVVAFAVKAGFRLDGESQINANPKDTHDYPKGVWTLPPGYAEGDKDRAKYAAIGESDRMTLRFVKPLGK
jgi:predicted methyltransferase